jgi:myo-inositol-1(or 4)-monophosphatase
MRTTPGRFELPDLRRLLEEADAIAARAAELLVAIQREDIGVTHKERRDVVTAADLASEKLVIEGLRALTPHNAILSEQAGASGPGTARWIVDPLDGTVNYAAGLPWFSVTLAYREGGRTRFGITRAPAAPMVALYLEGGVAAVDGEPAAVSPTARLADAVVSVMLTSHYSGEEVWRASEIVRRLGVRARGVRIIVSGALEMSLVAAGRLDAFVSLKADIVSHAAAMPLVRAARGRVTTLAGADSTDEAPEKIASNGAIHDELLDAIAGV